MKITSKYFFDCGRSFPFRGLRGARWENRKNIGGIVFLFLFTILVSFEACKTGTKPKQTVEFLNADSFSFNGLNIIQSRLNGPVASVQVWFDLRNTDEVEGASHIYLKWLANSYPSDKSKQEFETEKERLGISFDHDCYQQAGVFKMKCPSKDFSEAISLFASLLMKPALDNKDFENIKAREKLIKLDVSNKEQSVKNCKRALLGIDHPYLKNPEGNYSSLSSLTAGSLSDWFRSRILLKSRMTLVIAGFSDQEKVVQEILYSMDLLAPGEVDSIPGIAENFDVDPLILEHKTGSLNYLNAISFLPSAKDPAFIPCKVAWKILGERLASKISRQYAFSTPPFISVVPGNPGYAMIQMETAWPSDWGKIILNEIADVKLNGFTEAELHRAATQLDLDQRVRMETAESQAELIGLSHSWGNWKYPYSFSKKIQNLEKKDVDEAFAHSCTSLSWGYCGDTTLINRKVFE